MTVPVPGDAPPGVVPQTNNALHDILRQITAQMSEAQRKTLYSASISKGGLTVQGGGSIKSLLANGVAPFYVGRLSYGDPPVIYDGIIMRRPDGSPIFYTFPVNGDVDTIAWRITDHLNNELVASDVVTGGLAKPWIPMPTINVAAASIPTTTSSSYIAVQSTGFVAKQQPYVRVRALLRSDTGGIGSARFTVNTTPAGSTVPIASGDFGWTTSQLLALPGDFYDDVRVELEVIRTNAVGSVGGVLVASQRQS